MEQECLEAQWEYEDDEFERERERERTGSWKEEKLIVPLEMRAGWDILKEHGDPSRFIDV